MKKDIKIVYSVRMQNYLESHGVQPIWEDDQRQIAAYRRTPTFLSLLERYTIEKDMIPNKL